MRRFHEIAFTPNVMREQTRRGSRGHYEKPFTRNDCLTAREIEFISARDGFYLATVSEIGWPYVQFRGGPPGFVACLDGRRLRFADFRGNYQFISVGNAEADDRCCMFFMDYRARKRLKLFGRLNFADVEDGQALRSELHVSGYRAIIERIATISVEAFEWNCSQHIPRRLTDDELLEEDDA